MHEAGSAPRSRCAYAPLIRGVVQNVYYTQIKTCITRRLKHAVLFLSILWSHQHSDGQHSDVVRSVTVYILSRDVTVTCVGNHAAPFEVKWVCIVTPLSP